MPDLLRIIAFWWKKIFLLASTAVVIAATILLLQPKLYLSVATALPANSATMDKARIFNPNILQLYPAVGSADELDKFLGIASLGNMYYELAKEHSLSERYKLSLSEAADKLRTRITVTRSKWNDLKVKAWDGDPQLAARLANAFLAKADSLYQKLQHQNDGVVLQRLRETLATKEKELNQAYEASDVSSPFNNVKVKGLEQQVVQLQQLANEYALSVQTPLPSLLVAEKAAPSPKPDRPKIWQTLAFVLFSALLFGVLVVLFLESRKHHAERGI